MKEEAERMREQLFKENIALKEEKSSLTVQQGEPAAPNPSPSP